MSRRRYIWDVKANGGNGGLVELSPDWSPTPIGHHTSEGEIYDGLRTTDGMDISSRKKRREYMKANGLTDPSDFKQHHQVKAVERAKFFTGATDISSGARKQSLIRAMEQLSRGRR